MSYFVQMKKDGVVIEVAPPSVENHQSLGWVVVEEPKTEETQSSDIKPLSKMNVEELKDFGVELGLDVSSLKTKKDLVSAIQKISESSEK